LYDLQGNNVSNLFYHAHAVEPVDEDTFILYDNDYHNQTDPLNEISRIVEITIDEDTMTANESWYYEGPSEYYSSGFGDADRLPNGNRLGAWGYHFTPATGTASALIEVNPDGDVVWQLDVEYTADHVYAIYRMERFRYTPSMTSPADIEGTNSSYSLSWDVLYNYRNKQNVTGNYTLYIDDVPSQTGLFEYMKYWRPSTITLDTGPLGIGIHNVTLEIDDGFGHKQSDSVEISVGTFQISRSGLTSMEKGQTESLPTWSGSTTQELFYNITLNGTLYEGLNWTGQDIVLDPTSIALGHHDVQFQLFNGSDILFDDSFSLQVYPAEPPVITPLQTASLAIFWNESLTLSWNFFDSMPDSWSLLVDGLEVNSSLWNETTYSLDWNLPTYPEGTYNITLIAYDIADHWSKHETQVTINSPNHPYILSGPDDQLIAWGTEDVFFEWVTYNAQTWTLLRNGSQIGSGDATTGDVIYTIADWYTEGWLAGTHNITLEVMKNDNPASHTFWLDIRIDPGDPYVDAVIYERSESYLWGNNSIGAPDGHIARIFEDYQSGYLTLDMGLNEEIVDESGNDFIVYATGGQYLVYATNTLSSPFTYIGTATGNHEFDLQIGDLSEARYVRITYSLGADVELDAVEALYHNTPPIDIDTPSLEADPDWYRVMNGTSMLLSWTASDETPLGYEIYVNSQLVHSDLWNGSDINYLFEPTETGVWNVTAVVYDIFGNSANVTIVIEVYKPNGSMLFIIGGVVVGIFIVVVVFLWMKKR
jgi:hypothetical protein